MALLEEKNAPKTTAGLPLKEALQEWLGWAGLGPDDQGKEQRAADAFMSSWPGKQRRLSVDGFTLRHGDKRVRALSKNGLAPATINLRIRTLNAFFGWAVERHLASQRLKIKQIKAQRKLPRVLNVQQEQALFERIAHLAQHQVDPRHRRFYRLHLRFLAIAHFTGTRRREIFYLPWVNIALNEEFIYIRSHALFNVKEGREKALPLAPALLSFL